MRWSLCLFCLCNNKSKTHYAQIQVGNSSDIEIVHKLAGATFITSTAECNASTEAMEKSSLG